MLDPRLSPQQVWYDKVYEQRSEVIHPYKLKLLELAIPYIANKSVLDVGCGTGQMTNLLQYKCSNVIGIDISLNGLMREKGSQRFIQTDIDKPLPFGKHQFDAVWCTEVIEHLKSPDILLHEFRRVLNPGGYLFLTTPNSAFHLYRYLHLIGKTSSELQHPGHLQFFSERSLHSLITRNNFQIIEVWGRAVYFAIPGRPFQNAFSIRKPSPHKLSGLLLEDTLTQGMIIIYTAYIRKAVSFWSDTLMIIAKNNLC